MSDVLYSLGILVGQQTNFDASRAGKVLKKLGWQRHQIQDGSRVYRKTEVKHQGRYAGKQEEVAWQRIALMVSKAQHPYNAGRGHNI